MKITSFCFGKEINNRLKMFEALKRKEKKISLIGLGYVGLPIALEFAKQYSVVGFDINEERVELMKKSIDPSKELESAAFKNSDIIFTADPNDLKEAHFHIIAVPTPVDNHKVPNLRPVQSASRTVGKVLKKGDYVIYESTVYPGCTEEDCVPILEELSGLKSGVDFKVGYSPERINPGDKNHTLTKIVKVVSGCDEEAADVIANVYDSIIVAGVYKASSIKVAEAAKVIENTQRDLNIALMNELSVIFDKMDIDTTEVLKAAGTKWNFLKFYPGLVGGHCIGVDPYYLTYKAQKLGYSPEVILSGRNINDSMPSRIAQNLLEKIVLAKKNPSQSRVLVQGITFKENVADIRNSKVSDLIKEILKYGIHVDVVDPHADHEEVKHEYNIDMVETPDGLYDAIVVAVNHNEYKDLDLNHYKSMMKENPILFDIKAMYPIPSKEENMEYWRM